MGAVCPNLHSRNIWFMDCREIEPNLRELDQFYKIWCNALDTFYAQFTGMKVLHTSVFGNALYPFTKNVIEIYFG